MLKSCVPHELTRHKCTKMIIVLLLICSGFTNALSLNCDNLALMTAYRDQTTIIKTNWRTLTGTWISERCETRPGPEFVLRMYAFKEDTSCVLIQHHYWDESCSNPKFTTVSHGSIVLRNSVVQPGAMDGHWKPMNITIIPHSKKAATHLNHLVANECPRQFVKSFKQHNEHVVFEQKRDAMPHLPIYGLINCLGSLKWAFNEIKLLKVQFRPILSSLEVFLNEVQAELFVGDIHSELAYRQFYSPTSFQAPLIKKVDDDDDDDDDTTFTYNKKVLLIKNPNAIPATLFTTTMNTQVPPYLTEKIHLPPLVWGEWVSRRCEIWPSMGLYLNRRFEFVHDDFTWTGGHFFYEDPLCTIPKFAVTATGAVNLIGDNAAIKGATDIDLRIDNASLTIHDAKMIGAIKFLGSCGGNKWQVNVPNDLSASSGCSYLGLVIPSTQYDIVKIETGYDGSWLMFLGQLSTNKAPGATLERPTAFQWPLEKCGEAANFPNFLREIYGEESSNTTIKNTTKLIFYITVVFIYKFR